MTTNCKFLVLTNPVKSREDEYNEWYTSTHLGDVLKLPGAVSAQRFRLSDTQRGEPPHAWKYMALYEVETEKLQEFVDALKARAGTAQMIISGAMENEKIALIYEQIAGKGQVNDPY